jgi:hypothetical protein
LADALDEKIYLTIDSEHRQITKREAMVHQLVNKSTTADLRATKMLFDMMKNAEQKAGAAPPAPEPRSLDEADKKVEQGFVERIREQVLAEVARRRARPPSIALTRTPPRKRGEGRTREAGA